MSDTIIKIERKGAPIPVTIIGGFLGAGKTTLLNEILTADHGVRAAVLVNDFGAINIDSKLVVGVEENETINLANGCICCNIREDLISACLLMLNRPEPPEIILIETSGVSDPYQVANTFINPDFKGAFVIKTILTMVDAEQFPKLKGEMAQLAAKQIEIADFLVLNKVDLVNAEELAIAKKVIHKVAPKSRILETSFGKIPLELVLSGTQQELKLFEQPEKHDHHAHNHAFSTWSWTGNQKLSLPKLKQVLDNLPETIYRAKGIIYLEEMPAYKVVMQMVGRRYDITETDKWDAEVPKTEIVLIGEHDGFDPGKLQQEFDACIGTGDDTNSPILRMMRKFAPEYLEETE
jgi:G3E family GTPase